MNNITISFDDVTDQVWEELRALYVQAFVAMSSNVSKDGLALMNHNPEKFWTKVFDRDKTRSNEKNYTFSITKLAERIVAYALHTYVNDAQYLYIHHFVVHPNYQGQGLGKELMRTILELPVDVQKVGLLTRTYNIQAQNFYNRLGFSASVDVPSAIHEYYSSDRVYMEHIVL